MVIKYMIIALNFMVRAEIVKWKVPHHSLSGMTASPWEAQFIKRINRFVGLVDRGRGDPLMVHVPSSGRMGELLIPGAPVIVEPFTKGGGHKTAGRC